MEKKYLARPSFEFKVSPQLIKALEKHFISLVSRGGNKPSTAFYPVGEEQGNMLVFQDKISFGTISSKDENQDSIFKGRLQINNSNKKNSLSPIVGTLNFKTGFGNYSFCKQ